MSDLSPLLGEERKSNFGAVRSVVDPIQTPFLTHKMRLCAAKGRSPFREVRYKWASIDHPDAGSSMKRRVFILGLCAVASADLSTALAQRNLRVVGIWWSPLQVREILTRYKARLAELGWME